VAALVKEIEGRDEETGKKKGRMKYMKLKGRSLDKNISCDSSISSQEPTTVSAETCHPNPTTSYRATVLDFGS